jgi:F0F1-type ATP synthase delta subunit
MKQNKVKNYAKALAQVAMNKKDNKKSFENFLALVKKNSLERKLREIVSLAEDIILEKQGKQKITLETARKITPAQKKTLNSVSKEGDIITEKLNPELIAGIKIIINDNKQFDGSLQKKLQSIF